MSQKATRNGRLIILGGCAAALLVTAGALRADLMVSDGFAKALGAAGTPAPFETATQNSALRSGQVGDEGYWLTRSEVESPAPFAKHLAIGNRITVAAREGGERVLQIVDVKAIGEPLSRATADAAPLRLLLVTCLEVDATESQKPIRFIIEGETGEAAALPTPPSAPKTL
jgi:hypothetical protein